MICCISGIECDFPGNLTNAIAQPVQWTYKYGEVLTFACENNTFFIDGSVVRRTKCSKDQWIPNLRSGCYGM